MVESKFTLFETINDLTSAYRIFQKIGVAYVSLNMKEEAQVLEAFSQWALEQEEAEWIN